MPTRASSTRPSSPPRSSAPAAFRSPTSRSSTSVPAGTRARSPACATASSARRGSPRRCWRASGGTASCCCSASRTPPRITSGRSTIRRSPRYDAAGAAALGNPLRRVYAALDDAIGRLIARVPDATVLVVSDHGFGGTGTTGVHLNRWLADEEYLAFAPRTRRARWAGRLRRAAVRADAGALAGAVLSRRRRAAGQPRRERRALRRHRLARHAGVLRGAELLPGRVAERARARRPRHGAGGALPVAVRGAHRAPARLARSGQRRTRRAPGLAARRALPRTLRLAGARSGVGSRDPGRLLVRRPAELRAGRPGARDARRRDARGRQAGRDERQPPQRRTVRARRRGRGARAGRRRADRRHGAHRS